MGKILFAIPFFSGVEFLNEAIQSVRAQTISDWILVVLDDAIDPGQSSAARQVVSSTGDARVTYRQNSCNLGMAQNWNQAFDLGLDFQLVCLLHADDRLKPTYAERMLAASQQYSQATAFFAAAAVVDSQGENKKTFADIYKQWLLPPRINGVMQLTGLTGVDRLLAGNFIFCPTLAFRPTSTPVRFNPRYKMVLDWDLTLRILLSGGTLVGLYQEALYEYRRHDDNATIHLTRSMRRFEEECLLLDEVANALEGLGQSDLAKKAAQKRVVRLTLAFEIVREALRGNFSQAGRYRQFMARMT